MKKPKCPHCGKKIRDVIGVYLQVPVLYYLKAQAFGSTSNPWRGLFHYRRKRKGWKIGAFSCRFCGKLFPKKQEKELWAYLKARHVLSCLEK